MKTPTTASGWLFKVKEKSNLTNWDGASMSMSTTDSINIIVHALPLPIASTLFPFAIQFEVPLQIGK